MGRPSGAATSPSVRVFVRPVVMLAIGALAGAGMWVLLMADDGSGDPLGTRVSRIDVRALATMFDRRR